mmetsp:Transcript_13217/g.26385  ORF Transcript_13217/g.26385 Transcript_13217/m.26385 type:complete len:244 (-) Transcript_13217:556-1287(-)
MAHLNTAPPSSKTSVVTTRTALTSTVWARTRTHSPSKKFKLDTSPPDVMFLLVCRPRTVHPVAAERAGADRPVQDVSLPLLSFPLPSMTFLRNDMLYARPRLWCNAPSQLPHPPLSLGPLLAPAHPVQALVQAPFRRSRVLLTSFWRVNRRSCESYIPKIQRVELLPWRQLLSAEVPLRWSRGDRPRALCSQRPVPRWRRWGVVVHQHGRYPLAWDERVPPWLLRGRLLWEEGRLPWEGSNKM